MRDLINRYIESNLPSLFHAQHAGILRELWPHVLWSKLVSGKISSGTFMPHSVFRLVNTIENSHSCCYTNFYLFAYVWPYREATNNVLVYSQI